MPAVAMRDAEDFAAYDCALSAQGAAIAECTLKAYRPRDIAHFLLKRRPRVTDTVLVTGSSRGIGRAIALRLAARRLRTGRRMAARRRPRSSDTAEHRRRRRRGARCCISTSPIATRPPRR